MGYRTSIRLGRPAYQLSQIKLGYWHNREYKDYQYSIFMYSSIMKKNVKLFLTFMSVFGFTFSKNNLTYES